ncbi:unnamed protein product [Cuscuta europaea]|uniref:SOSEKI DIX-like domain-containing protein n=1 Tax=Cuscuta europaea TaxID=41803 RepID=A0A9P0ZS55_CUSEU|nr:unnamed protein product [Cuscuta europaea]
MTGVSAGRHRCDTNGRGRGGSPPPEKRPLPAAALITPRPLVQKVQIVYYLSRNGLLDHPHFMEVALLPTRHLRLKDVMDRLTVLRGKGMLSLYSWSCKRSYKNGYVWNDLAENDVIYPCEGAEYILKGSELFHPSSEKSQVNNAPPFDLVTSAHPVKQADFSPKRRPPASKRHPEPEEVVHKHSEQEEDDYQEKISITSTCSKAHIDKSGVSDRFELARGDSSPPSTASSLSEKCNDGSNTTSQRYEDGDPVVADSLLSRNSVLFQLISCGGSASFRAKSLTPFAKQSPAISAAAVGRKSCSGGALKKEALIRAAAANSIDDEEEIIIKYMSENPRFGNMQSQEKEYFSGSILDSIAAEEKSQIPPSLQKSNSYNEERKCRAGLEEVGAETEVKQKAGKAGNCIPIKKSSSKQSSKK